MFDIPSELYNKFLDKYFDEYYDLEGRAEKEDLSFKFMPINLRIKGYDYNQFMKKYQMMILMLMILMNLLIFQTCDH